MMEAQDPVKAEATAASMSTIRQRARTAGVWYLLLALSAPFGLLYVPAVLIAPGDAVATADNLRASEWVLRAGIASELIHQVIAVFLVLALYRLFMPVRISLARQLVVFGALVSVPIMFVNVLNELAALTLVGDADWLTAIDRTQRDALAFLALHLHSRGVLLASVFWGLWLFPFGRLILLSGFIPRWLGVLLMIAGGGYLVQAFTALVLPQYQGVVSRFTEPMQFCELPIIFWLLIWGARAPSARGEPST